MNFLTFLTATCFLLAMPGPTNTLLATSGAGVGISHSLHLLAAELCGYLAAIALLRLALGPIVSDIPLAAVVLRVAVTVYILGLAVMLWRVNARGLRDGAVVTFRQVLLTTLLNPKAMVFAFLLLPLQAGLFELLPWLGVIALLIVMAGAAWVTLGATLGRAARRRGRPELITRTGAVTLVAVTGLIWLQSFLSA
ncbi:LysE family translocator [Bradyrhizobium iriomotense]|uniref:LysE family translocator n=1 Tax=Bradyrhizobium iriomotense TaxID=441950 RepID=UPI001B8A631C|nr:LysE family transporter [Bradyrhizobium iriomotense]MBR0786396.1 LysE family transporter [Bradyrhizobium iriomotense]